MGDDDQQVLRPGFLDDPRHQFLGRRVDPVGVLDDPQHGALPAQGFELDGEGGQGQLPPPRRRQVGEWRSFGNRRPEQAGN